MNEQQRREYEEEIALAQTDPKAAGQLLVQHKNEALRRERLAAAHEILQAQRDKLADNPEMLLIVTQTEELLERMTPEWYAARLSKNADAIVGEVARVVMTGSKG